MHYHIWNSCTVQFYDSKVSSWNWLCLAPEKYYVPGRPYFSILQVMKNWEGGRNEANMHTYLHLIHYLWDTHNKCTYAIKESMYGHILIANCVVQSITISAALSRARQSWWDPYTYQSNPSVINSKGHVRKYHVWEARHLSLWMILHLLMNYGYGDDQYKWAISS